MKGKVQGWRNEAGSLPPNGLGDPLPGNPEAEGVGGMPRRPAKCVRRDRRRSMK